MNNGQTNALTNQDILLLQFWLFDFKTVNPTDNLNIATHVKHQAIKQITSDITEYHNLLIDCDEYGFFGTDNAFNIHPIKLMSLNTNSIPFKNLLAWYNNDLSTLLNLVNGGYLYNHKLYFYIEDQFDYKSNIIVALSNGMYFTKDAKHLISNHR